MSSPNQVEWNDLVALWKWVNARPGRGIYFDGHAYYAFDENQPGVKPGDAAPDVRHIVYGRSDPREFVRGVPKHT